MKEVTNSMRDAFGNKLADLAKHDSRIVALDGDLGNSTRLSYVEELVPNAFLQMGIAEQNMVGVAAGMATTGLIPWACSFAAFVTRRAYDQIVVSVDQPRLNVKLVGSYSGLLTSNTGKSHHSFEDIALTQTLPNMVVLSPGDALETVRMMDAMVAYDGPVYLRLSRDETLEHLPGSDEEFKIGKSRTLHEGKRVACLSTGAMTPRAFGAVQALAKKGIDVTLVHFPTIKPLDEARITELAETHDYLITMEEHYTSSGFGSSVNAVTSRTSPTFVIRIGIDNAYSQCGKDVHLLEYHGLTSEQLATRIKQVYEGHVPASEQNG